MVVPAKPADDVPSRHSMIVTESQGCEALQLLPLQATTFARRAGMPEATALKFIDVFAFFRVLTLGTLRLRRLLTDMAIDKNGSTTITGVAVAVVALTRFIDASNPNLAPYLKHALTSAETAGLAPADLELLRTIIGGLGAS